MKRNSFFKCVVIAALALVASASFGATALPHHFTSSLGLDASTMLMGIGSLAGAGTAFNKKIRELMARKAQHVTTMRAITDKAALEGREPTADELTQFDAASVAAQAAAAGIEREQGLLALEASTGVVVSDNAHITASSNAANDPKRGFKSIGDFYAAVAKAGMRKSFDERLTINAAAPTTFSNESGGTDGGFAIPPAFSKDLWRLSLGEDSLIPKTANTEIGGNSMIFPKDESTPWGGTGAQVYWQAEASVAQQSKVNMGTQAMVLHKLMGLVPVTNELVEDGFAIGSYLTPLLADRITWKVNESILFGTGVGQPLGALTNAGVSGPAILIYENVV